MHYTALKNNLLCVKQVRGCHPLLSHLSLLDDVVGVTAGEAGTLQKVHDIILTATITDAIKKVITWIHRVISCGYMDGRSTAILTSPSSCLKSTGPSLRQWRAEGRLPLCRSGGRDIYCWSRGESRTAAAELAGYVTELPGCMITVSHAVKNNLWISRVVQTSGLHRQNNKLYVYWRQCCYNQWSVIGVSSLGRQFNINWTT